MCFSSCRGSVNCSKEKEVVFSETADFCTLDPLSNLFQFVSENGGAEGDFLDESVDESRVTSVSEKKIFVTRLLGSKVYTVSSEVFESEI